MTGESGAFFASMICGASMLLLWDILYGLRRALKCGAVADTLLDILWWTAFAAVFTVFLWNANSLRIRGYEFIAAAAAAFLYHITVSKVIKRVFCVIFDVILKIFRFILKILLTPAVFLYKILIRPFKNLCRKRRSAAAAKAAEAGGDIS